MQSARVATPLPNLTDALNALSPLSKSELFTDARHAVIKTYSDHGAHNAMRHARRIVSAYKTGQAQARRDARELRNAAARRGLDS